MGIVDQNTTKMRREKQVLNFGQSDLSSFFFDMLHFHASCISFLQVLKIVYMAILVGVRAGRMVHLNMIRKPN